MVLDPPSRPPPVSEEIVSVGMIVDIYCVSSIDSLRAEFRRFYVNYYLRVTFSN